LTVWFRRCDAVQAGDGHDFMRFYAERSCAAGCLQEINTSWRNRIQIQLPEKQHNQICQERCIKSMTKEKEGDENGYGRLQDINRFR
jgi:hypothetical protein